MGVKWADWLRAEGMSLPVVRGPVFPNFTVLLLELIAARGIALGYAHVVDQLLVEGRIVRLSDRSVRTGLGFYAVCRDPNALPIQPVIELFRKGGCAAPR
jgi:hypothetical protein